MTTNNLYSTTAITFDLSDPDVTHVTVRLSAEDPAHTALNGLRYAGFQADISVIEIVQGIENGDFPPYHEWSTRPHNA